MRFTVILTIVADGSKLNPLIVFKNLKKVPKGDYPKDIRVAVTKSGTTNTELMETFRKEIWQKRGEYSGIV